jgi:hypothetical protein
MPVPATLPVNKFGGPSLRVGNIISAALSAPLSLSVDGSEIIAFTATAGPHTVTLPAAAECAGQIRQISNAGSNAFAVAGFTGGPITLEQRGALAATNDNAWSATFACDGSSWFITDWSISS